MKRYLLFEYSDYYPSGGMNDYTGDFNSVEEAKIAAKKYVDWVSQIERFDADNVEIYDTQEAKFVFTYTRKVV